MTDPKQEIFDILYQFNGGESVLDVGCGYPFIVPSGLSSYEAVDLKLGTDWYDHIPPACGYDIIIANDIFPNVDQRLELFLEKYLPRCREMRLSLTYFDAPKWYRAKRVDGDEVLTMKAWTRSQIAHTFSGHLKAAITYPGTFPNGRGVLLVWLKGGLA